MVMMSKSPIGVKCQGREIYLKCLSVSVPGGVCLGRAFPRWRTREPAFWPLAEKLSFNGIASYGHSAKNVVPGSWK